MRLNQPLWPRLFDERPALRGIDDLGHVLACHVEHVDVVVLGDEGLDFGLERQLLL
ncbi:MAG: hypothetical protein M5U19_10345 [Microthrixaceae bacterium]|nr:hypothetical protein [Microthrixaceae bacterium]